MKKAAVHSFTVLPALPDSICALEGISQNMFWSWNPEFIELFKRIDCHLWAASGHNPVKLLASASQQRLQSLAGNQGFLYELGRAEDKLAQYLNRPKTFEGIKSEPGKPLIAYFSAEFGIHESLPFYAGGLGVLAGDYLKSASDLGIPIVGVGLLYQKGYFRQYLNVDGWQQELYLENDFYNMPVKLVCKENGEPLTISVEYPGRNVLAQVWSVTIGRVKLYLLDTNIDANSPTDRLITASLYAGDREMRIRQEIMLGIGGLRALIAMNIEPKVCHMNEGHAAFMVLERIRQFRRRNQLCFDEALAATRASNIFTMHTPVKAGLDEFTPELIEKYFASYISSLGVEKNEFLALGRILPDDNGEPFKMPVLALRFSSYVNGVSELHGQISRRMWSSLWPKLPIDEVPIASVTNGVHTKSWLSSEMLSLYENYLGLNSTELGSDESAWENVEQIPDEQLWAAHQMCKGHLIAFARECLKTQMKRRGTYHTELNWAEEVLDPEALTIGFARRFVSYKRANLLLKEPKRLAELLINKEHPVQIILAGKAHPRDTEGKSIIREIIHYARQYDLRRRIIFLEDYDINIARFLVQGVDVWLGVPRRPMEASGTSGMKAAINGALNISTLDGWWCQGYSPKTGWAIGSNQQYTDITYQDMAESQALYNILENEVVPLFYTRSTDNLPRAWIKKMKNSISAIAPVFNTHRMIREYTNRFYKPALDKWAYLTSDGMAKAKALSKWESEIRKVWPEVAVADVQVHLDNGQTNEQLNTEHKQIKVGSKLDVKALVKLAGINPKDVSVELYYGPVDNWGNITDGSAVTMSHNGNKDNNGEHWFGGSIDCMLSGRQGVTVRVVPNHIDLVNPHELNLICWQKTDADSD
ncbi:MAG: alpha-glucan family phosphorylase [Sedimentisphaerales bacterium]|nr:alpha-glucan family phosphorylase [Sedimentisphaerales bacterium]